MTGSNSDEALDLVGLLQLPREEPTLRIVVVSDLDLASASALAEYALHDDSIAGGNVDLLLACGPFCRDEDLGPYLTRRVNHRTPELTAALEGFMTGALSQLESIVCRVCFCPAGPDDPETTWRFREEGPLRLTPNSRNVHGEWLPLAPALGCCGVSIQPGLSLAEYCHELSRQTQQLLSLAAPPPSDIDVPLSETTQAILLTTNMELETTSLTDYFSVCLHRHSSVCLNVLGGIPKRMDVSPGGDHVRIVSPGSLRQHGDFCWIDLGLVEDAHTGVYHWKVQHVEFANIRRPR